MNSQSYADALYCPYIYYLLVIMDSNPSILRVSTQKERKGPLRCQQLSGQVFNHQGAQPVHWTD